jgi:ankyrin repeat protein
VTAATISPTKNQELMMLDRRGFLSSLAAGGAIAGLPISVLAQAAKDAAKLPSKDVYEKDEDTYWAELRKQFLIPADVVYLNNGTVGSSPGNRPLDLASYRGDLADVIALVEGGADVNAVGDLGSTPLHEAVEQGRVQIVKFLLEQGAVPKVKNELGKTALDIAQEKGALDNIAKLLRDRAEPS